MQANGKTFDRFCRFRGSRKNIIGISNRTPYKLAPPPIDGTSDATSTPKPRRQHKFHGGNQSQCRLEERPGAAVAVVGSVDVEEVEEVSMKNLRSGQTRR